MRNAVQAALLSGRWTKVYTAAATAMLSQGHHLTGTEVDEVVHHAKRIADAAEERGMTVSEANMERMVVLTDKMRRANASPPK